MKDDRNSKGKEYKKWKFSVFVRDGWACKKCSSEENLHAHHIIGWNDNINLRYDVDNGLTLCSSCHTRLHALGRTAWNKGKKLDIEGRRKLSEAHKGQKPWNKGLKSSPESIEKMKRSKIGKKIGPMSEEHKRKIGLANRERLIAIAKANIGKKRKKCTKTGKLLWID
jgi:NUMOD3 motif/HNH endonuclease